MTAKKDISQDILEYLGTHPDASDTLEGITEWWLLTQRISYEMRKVREAVSKLVKHGWIVEIKGSDGTIRYRLNLEKIAKSKKIAQKIRN
jgi:DNA-binding transcriptional regulator PaaX